MNFKMIVFIYLLLSSLTLFSQETNAQLEFLDTLENKSDIYLLYAIEYGSLDAKVKSFEILSKRETDSKDILDAAHKYITYGYDNVYAEHKSSSYNWNVRYWASQTIKRFNDVSSIPYLISVLDVETESRVILSSINTLGNIQSSESVDALLKLMRRYSKDPNILIEVITSLGKIGDSKALPQLIEISENQTYKKSIRTKAAEAAGKLKDPEHLPKTTSVDLATSGKTTEKSSTTTTE